MALVVLLLLCTWLCGIYDHPFQRRLKLAHKPSSIEVWPFLENGARLPSPVFQEILAGLLMRRRATTESVGSIFCTFGLEKELTVRSLS